MPKPVIAPVGMVERGGSRAWLLCALVTVALRLPLFFLPFFTKDEATYSALAAKLLSGSLFYVGAVDHKPPGIAMTYAAVFWVTGRYNLLFVRLLLVAAVVATSVLIGETARRVYRSPGARIAGLLYAAASAIGLPGDMQAANTELFLNLPLAAAAFLVAGAEGEGVAAFVAAGFLTGVAALFKYQAAAAGVAWAAAALAAGGGAGRVTSRLAALVAGIAPVAIGLCGFYWIRGEWPAFWFWGWQYNFAYMSLVTPSVLAENAVFYTIVAALFWLPLLIGLAERRMPRPFLALAWLAAMVPALAAGGRFFPHYYLMPLPPICLLAAPGVLSFARERSVRLRIALVFAALSVAVTLVLSWGWYRIKPGLAGNQRGYTSVAAYVNAHTGPDDRIFVWGNSPEIYVDADRVMATRFAFCNYMTGKIWGTDAADTDILDTDRFAVPRAWDELIQDLGRTPPAVIVDAAAGNLDGFGLNAASRYPDLWEIIQRGYRQETVVDGVPVYRRIAAGL
jgi:4-amino-4-deoxy-L-arabinose transferase-like glycosyltransferase